MKAKRESWDSNQNQNRKNLAICQQNKIKISIFTDKFFHIRTNMDAKSLLDEVNPEIEHLVREALQSQADLREYSKNIEKELREVGL